MSTHTPGPWEVGDEVDSQGSLVYVPIRRGKLHISTTGVYGRKPDGTTAGAKYTDRFGTERHKPIISAEECRANARLIAASPDLLVSLEEMVAALISAAKFGLNDSEVAMLKRAEAAVAKAEGEQP